MNLTISNEHKIIALMEKGVRIPNPMSLYLDDHVQVAQISGDGVTLYPGCRIYGSKTTISRGAQIGYEGPATVENCSIGPDVELKGGYFKDSVFLEKSKMGLGAHVREGTILEEKASGAHCVGLKQTILFPFVTLGSLINFCDCLLSGGTGRRDHSEVGSSYIHFNFSVTGDKTTPSLFGDVPRGVMLNQRPIFLGGQGGAVGPLRIGFGNVVSAGSILRKDFRNKNRLIMEKPHRGGELPFVFNRYAGLAQTVEKNLFYLAGLTALEQWYRYVRRDFLNEEALGYRIYNGALDTFGIARGERIKRLKALAEKMPDSAHEEKSMNTKNRKLEFFARVDEACSVFEVEKAMPSGHEHRDRFLEALDIRRSETEGGYIRVIQSLSEGERAHGIRWLEAVMDDRCQAAAACLPSMNLFKQTNRENRNNG